ncbi:DUF559 domain-containing protein [Candidatus Uabimicrobium amorphum]|nr:DUF559 domain-containing protein [Candidatus Uabimicrobium amorphum]
MVTKTVKVTANNCPYKGRSIQVYDAEIIESLISMYALALAYRQLRENQKHIGERCVFLLKSLVRTALESAIQEACGFIPQVQQTAQNHYSKAISLIQKMGFHCTVDQHIATKKDIASFLNIPISTLNSFLYKHSYEIKPIKLDSPRIRSFGSKASRMNGYHLHDIVKIIFGIDTEVTARIKQEMFGQLGTFAKLDSRSEIEWRSVLKEIFSDFDFKCNHPIGKYRYYVDYFVPELQLCLECNGYDCHRSYDAQKEKEREQIITQNYGLIRFHHKVKLETLVNAILKIKPGSVIRLYDQEKIAQT